MVGIRGRGDFSHFAVWLWNYLGRWFDRVAFFGFFAWFGVGI